MIIFLLGSYFNYMIYGLEVSSVSVLYHFVIFLACTVCVYLNIHIPVQARKIALVAALFQLTEFLWFC